MLLDALVGTERGLTARGETKARINELIVQLESQNPTPSPTAVLFSTSSKGECYLDHGIVEWRMEVDLYIQSRSISDVGIRPFAIG